MIGETISHYRIIELLGAGGMGVVYKAEDARLKRLVALKFLPQELTLNSAAKERLVQEAQSASALDHPNICTIHEIDETPDGRLFLAMAYYDGETLKERIARGPLTIDEAVDVATQVARGVAAAHDAGIIHRDIKAANIILTRRGEVKLLDFGLAKLVGQTGLTRTGTTLGTVAYMAPEQVAGAEANQRTDVWALGVVLYEALLGRPPFAGPNDAALLHAILHDAPRPMRAERSEIPEDLERIVMRALEKDPGPRFASAGAFLEQLQLAHAPSSGATRTLTPGVPPRRFLARPRIAVAAALIAALLTIAGMWSLGGRQNPQSDLSMALPAIKRHISQDNYVAAFVIAKNAERALAGEPEFAGLWPQLSVTRSWKSEPAGASVYVRDAALRSDWQSLGQTPLSNVRVPAGVLRWKIEKPGFEAAEFIGPATGPFAANLSLDLGPAGTLSPNTIKVPAGGLQLILTGYDYNTTVQAGPFLIDKYEVTNREFKEFIDQGGYTNRQYWKHEFRKDGSVVAWDDALAQFRDTTGRPGPSTWEVGTYPPGQETYPVGGVSWYEAAAYAEFRGRSLPTVYHWLRAAGTWFASNMTPHSNFGRSGPLPVGKSTAVSGAGVYDAAGNLKEWCWNEMDAGATRYILGGAWNEPDYMFIYPDARAPFDRSATNGFRTVKYLASDSLPPQTTGTIRRPKRDYSVEKPVADDVFRALRSVYAYDAASLDATVDEVDDSAGHFRKERVSFTAAYGKDRVTAYLFLPKNAKPPFQAVLFWPGSGAIRARSSDPLPDQGAIDYLMVSGRAVVYPVYFGTYERGAGRDSSWPEPSRAYRDWVMKQVNDARRSLDYLETRPDIRHDTVGYFGVSWGARMGSVVLAHDPRLRAAVLVAGGFSPGDAPPETDPLNFAPRVSVPVLMLNGNKDFIFDTEQSQKPLFRFLGSPADRKKHVVYEAGHAVFLEKRSQVIREALDWFDRYLGPV